MFSASILVPKLTLDSYQILKGKVVGIPLVWKGQMTCNITKVRCDFNAPFEPVKIDGVDYLKFDDKRLKLHLDVEHVRVKHKESSPGERVVGKCPSFILTPWSSRKLFHQVGRLAGNEEGYDGDGVLPSL